MNFYELEISKVKSNTKNAVSVELLVPMELKEKFQFQAGQHLVLDFKIERNKYHRTYSICSAPYESTLRISVKRQDKGIISNYINDGFFKGLKVRVSEPMGHFYDDEQITNSSNIILWAGGSGITAILSIAKHILKSFSQKNVILIYANRDQQSIMFENEIETLKKHYAERFKVTQILSNNAVSDGFIKRLFSFFAAKKPWTGLTGYITKLFIEKIATQYPNSVHYLCGPEKLMEICEITLKEKNVSSIYLEQFVGSSASINNSNKEAFLKVNLSSKNYEIELLGNSILEGMLAAKLNPPHACKMGTCGSCKATLVSGEVIVARDFALNEADREANKILCCQSWAKTEKIVIEY